MSGHRLCAAEKIFVTRTARALRRLGQRLHWLLQGADELYRPVPAEWHAESCAGTLW
jgi:hypothetical protein